MRNSQDAHQDAPGLAGQGQAQDVSQHLPRHMDAARQLNMESSGAHFLPALREWVILNRQQEVSDLAPRRRIAVKDVRLDRHVDFHLAGHARNDSTRQVIGTGEQFTLSSPWPLAGLRGCERTRRCYPMAPFLLA